jgi:hypothetical protein
MKEPTHKRPSFFNSIANIADVIINLSPFEKNEAPAIDTTDTKPKRAGQSLRKYRAKRNRRNRIAFESRRRNWNY